uniref:Fe2OG dioxygenase domain-containing protein n=1 Tax=Odontella aurita TaxID=265563 RepID=A0A6U6CDW6_9STRA|mmetsp:Transcript_10688/g.31618  ORF Transcript_10688/g.31618 Transcript_10688/m.31618 type:complete len:350 (+) Transcript_10688:67-1116(+)
MARFRLLPFVRFANSTGEPSESMDRLRQDEQFFVPSQKFNATMWGCDDELGAAACSDLPGLFSDDGTTCRWPSAELCLSTCGQCPLVEAAKKCTSLPQEMDERMLNEHMNWAAFFARITSPEMAAGREHLRGAHLLNAETPWVAEFPNYLSESEADELIRISKTEGYRIEDEHPKDIRDVNVTNCDSIRCMRQPFMSELSRRASELLGLHPNNFESMEFINYGPGQHYVWHSDEHSWRYPIRDPAAVIAGPRLLTMFYYLSDVEEGGETAFAGPDSTGRTKRLFVSPKKGKVILWANMKDDWRSNEPAAMHAALPVRRGRKFAGTLWVHASGFRVPELYSGIECNPRYV